MHWMFLAEGFEEIEALCPLDLMRRAGLSVCTVGIGGKMIKGSHGIVVESDIDGRSFDPSAQDIPESVILPGGMPGTKNLEASPIVQYCLKQIKEGVWPDCVLAAICAAPSVPGKLGLYQGRKATCFPGFEKDLIGVKPAKDKVVSDGPFITGAGMGVALDFGLCIVERFCGKDKAQSLRKGVQAP